MGLSFWVYLREQGPKTLHVSKIDAGPSLDTDPIVPAPTTQIIYRLVHAACKLDDG